MRRAAAAALRAASEAFRVVRRIPWRRRAATRDSLHAGVRAVRERAWARCGCSCRHADIGRGVVPASRHEVLRVAARLIGGRTPAPCDGLPGDRVVARATDTSRTLRRNGNIGGKPRCLRHWRAKPFPTARWTVSDGACAGGSSSLGARVSSSPPSCNEGARYRRTPNTQPRLAPWHACGEKTSVLRSKKRAGAAKGERTPSGPARRAQALRARTRLASPGPRPAARPVNRANHVLW